MSAPKILLATADYDRDLSAVVLKMQDKDGTAVDFELMPMAAGILALTLTPALKVALAEDKRLHPENHRLGVPDTPEGL